MCKFVCETATDEDAVAEQVEIRTKQSSGSKKKKDSKSVEQLRSEVAVADREYATSKEAKQLRVEFEKCEVELKQCSRLIRRRRSNPLASFARGDFLKMFVSHDSCAKDARAYVVILTYFKAINDLALLILGILLSARLYSVRMPVKMRSGTAP